MGRAEKYYLDERRKHTVFRAHLRVLAGVLGFMVCLLVFFVAWMLGWALLVKLPYWL